MLLNKVAQTLQKYLNTNEHFPTENCLSHRLHSYQAIISLYSSHCPKQFPLWELIYVKSASVSHSVQCIKNPDRVHSRKRAVGALTLESSGHVFIIQLFVSDFGSSQIVSAAVVLFSDLFLALWSPWGRGQSQGRVVITKSLRREDPDEVLAQLPKA